MVGNVIPHSEINPPPEAAHVKDAVLPLCNPMVGLLRPGFRWLEKLHDGQHEAARRRFRLARVIRA